ncbi:MAG: penicillin-binding protein, partial [Clostridia bacterium]|nr:penicillin-binding protein [Clostridia bacterium]
MKTVKSILKKIGFTLLTLVLIGITTATICIVAGAAYVKYYISPTIDINLDDFRLNFTSFVYYVDKETGEEIKFEELHGSENRVWVDYEDIPQTLIDAYISVEDSRFYEHDGVDWKRTIGAMINYIVPIRDNFGGGSTITQQLIKNLTGDNETSVKRKVQEIMRALELEAKYDKDEILELYLNTIYLGQGANGVKAAAKVYFGKELNELNLVECAAIAGISKNPYKYDIIRFPEFNEERRATVLMTMRDNLKITEEEYQKALKTEVSTENSEKLKNADIEQSYFVDEVIMSVKEDLMEEKGYSEALASQLLYTGGLKIVTTLDPDIQAKMDAVFIDEDNLPGILGSDGTMPQASMVITD